MLMQKEGRQVLFVASIIALIIGLFFVLNFVIAVHSITAANGITNTTFNFLEDNNSAIFNVTVNNTDAPLTANITQVNITIPSSFTFIAATNRSDAIPHTFTNTSTVLSFTNATGLVMNLTWQRFVFNATAATPGTYNITVRTVNSSGVFETNLTAVINDTTRPSAVSFDSTGSTQGANLSATSISVNISATDNGVIGRIHVKLFNATNSQISTNNSSAGATSFLTTFSGLTDGTYYINATINDTYNNLNFTETLNITLDTVDPTVSISEDTSTKTTIAGTIGVSDARTGANLSSCIAVGDSDVVITGTGGSQSLSKSSLTCGTDYSITIRCIDRAGNDADATEVFTTSACSNDGSNGGGSSGGSSGGSNSDTDWTATYSEDSQTLESRGEVSRELGAKSRMRIKIDTEVHFVGVVSIGSNTALIEVASTPVQASLGIGETEKFDTNSDGYYDMSVTLESITAGKAKISVKPLHEEVPVEEVAEENTPTDDGTTTTNTETESSSKTWWIVAIIVIIIAIAGAFYYYKKR